MNLMQCECCEGKIDENKKVKNKGWRVEEEGKKEKVVGYTYIEE